MTTLDGSLVLFRVISVADDKRSCTVQWVMAPPGATSFAIPKGATIQPEREPEPLGGAARTGRIIGQGKFFSEPNIVLMPADWERIEQIEKAGEAYLENRKATIREFMNLLEGNGRKSIYAYLSNRMLGEMRATEAVPLLVSMIDTQIPHGVTLSITIDSMFPCVTALINIGKPGASACLEQIVRLTLEERERPFKEKLLCLVIVRVEGEKIARILLEDKKETLTDPQEMENVERAIGLIEEVKSW
jgi:hypothetical protein